VTAQDTGTQKEEVKQPLIPVPLSEFFESTSPSQVVPIPDVAARKWSGNYGTHVDLVRTPDIQLHCTSASCNGPRFFRYLGEEPQRLTVKWQFFYLKYQCWNCQQTDKTFSLAAKLDAESKPSGHGYKFGELPPFGPPTPGRLIALIGPDRDEFLKGRRCEIQGLGVGAFTYYRRVVVNQKNRILGEVIKVAERIDPGSDALKELKAAVSETQFSKSLEMVKTAIPQTLLINGHNPLTLLHGALSDGLHDRTDEECLQTASSVRVILAELSERLAQALKDEAEITKALGTLMRRPGSDPSG
jgi:hypothetical protein